MVTTNATIRAALRKLTIQELWALRVAVVDDELDTHIEFAIDEHRRLAELGPRIEAETQP